MLLAFRNTVWLTVLAGHIVSGFSDIVANSVSTCGPTLATVAHITTITIESIITVPHSCHTQTITTRHHGSGCPNLSTCAMHAECIMATTQTIMLPPSDPCCPTTPTVTAQGPCPICQKGCSTETVTKYLTADVAHVERRKEAAVTTTSCTKTVFGSGSSVVGPTKTFHPLTYTTTSFVQCSGCKLLTSILNGLGPYISFTTTITNTALATSTTWVCA